MTTNLSPDDVIAVEITAYDPNKAGTRTLYYATTPFATLNSDTPAATVFDGRVQQGLDIHRTMFAPKTTKGRSSMSLGDIVLLNGDGALDKLKDYGVDGRTITVRRGPVGAAYPSGFTTDFVGTMNGVEVGLTDVHVKLRDNQALLDVPLQTTKYTGAGLGTLEGTASDLKGKPKPVCYGTVLNISPPCVETAKLIYQVADAAVNSIDAVYDQGVALTSGRSWALGTAPGTSLKRAFAYSGSLYVAAGNSGTLQTSPDYTTWTLRTSTFGATDIYGAAYGAGVFVIVGLGGKAASSADGITWTSRTSGFGTEDIIDVIFVSALSLFIAVGYYSVGVAGGIATSADGTTWTLRYSTAPTPLRSVAYGNGIVVAVGGSGAILSSPDGITWTVRQTSYTSANFQSVVYGNGRFVAGGNVSGLGCFTASSTEGVTWVRGADAFASGQVSAMTYGSVFMAVGPLAQIATSQDGLSWTRMASTVFTATGESLYEVFYDGSVYLVTGFNAVHRMAVFAAATYASTGALLDNTVAPAAGEYVVYKGSEGSYFRLGSQPVGLVTADVTQGANAAARTAAQVYKLLLARASLVPNAGDVTTLDAAAAYVIGYWSDAETLISTVLDLVTASVGAAWFPDKSGTFRIKQLLAPTGSSSVTFTENDSEKPLERIQSNDVGQGVPTYQCIVRGAQNYTVQDTDLAGGVTQARREVINQQWLEAKATDATVQTAHPLALQSVEDSLLSTVADALTEATRRQALRGVAWDMYEFVTKWTAATAAVELNDEAELCNVRFGLSIIGDYDTGTDFRVIGIHIDAEARECTFTLWGGGPQTISNIVTDLGEFSQTDAGAYGVTA